MEEQIDEEIDFTKLCRDRYVRKVNYYETDRMQITHHSNYIRFMEEARVYFLEKLGWGYDRFEKEGVVSPVIHVEFNYRKSTTYPDELEIQVRVVEAGGVRLSLAYKMFCRGELVGDGKTAHCFLNSDGRPISYKKKYPEFYDLIKQWMKADKKYELMGR